MKLYLFLTSLIDRNAYEATNLLENEILQQIWENNVTFLISQWRKMLPLITEIYMNILHHITIEISKEPSSIEQYKNLYNTAFMTMLFIRSKQLIPLNSKLFYHLLVLFLQIAAEYKSLTSKSDNEDRQIVLFLRKIVPNSEEPVDPNPWASFEKVITLLTEYPQYSSQQKALLMLGETIIELDKIHVFNKHNPLLQQAVEQFCTLLAEQKQSLNIKSTTVFDNNPSLSIDTISDTLKGASVDGAGVQMTRKETIDNIKKEIELIEKIFNATTITVT